MTSIKNKIFKSVTMACSQKSEWWLAVNQIYIKRNGTWNHGMMDTETDFSGD